MGKCKECKTYKKAENCQACYKKAMRERNSVLMVIRTINMMVMTIDRFGLKFQLKEYLRLKQ